MDEYTPMEARGIQEGPTYTGIFFTVIVFGGDQGQ